MAVNVLKGGLIKVLGKFLEPFLKNFLSKKFFNNLEKVFQKSRKSFSENLKKFFKKFEKVFLKIRKSFFKN